MPNGLQYTASEIEDVIAYEILDSRGNATLGADVVLRSNDKNHEIRGRAMVPSGASAGVREKLELRDGDMSRYRGQGVIKAVNNVNETILKAIKGKEFNQQTLDQVMIELDGTDNKSNLGANAMLAVSMAFAHAAAAERGLPLYRHLNDSNALVMPVPMMNIINGGAHANNSIDMQEFMIMPVGAKNFAEAMRMGSEVFHALKKRLNDEGHSVSVGDEGGFAPNLPSSRAALDLIMVAIKDAGYEPGKDVAIALDAASSEFYKNGKYRLEGEGMALTSDEMIDYYEALCRDYPIKSIEDGLDQDDWTGWKKLTDRLGKKVLLVGDDLFVTNVSDLKKGIDGQIANSILVKVNQIGTLSETFAAIEMAKQARYAHILSHRSGETEDTTISDIAVATNAPLIKAGSLSRSDRLAKYNRLLYIDLMAGRSGKDVRYAGQSAFQYLDLAA